MNPCTVENIEHTPDGLLLIVRALDTGRQYAVPVDTGNMTAALERQAAAQPTPEPLPLAEVTEIDGDDDSDIFGSATPVNEPSPDGE